MLPVKGGRERVARTILESMDGLAIIKNDSSTATRDADTNGFELVTIPATLERAREIFDDCFFRPKLPQELGLRAWDAPKYGASCGMHIHVSREPLGLLQLGRILVFIHEPNNLEFIKTLAGRGNTRWSEFTTERKWRDALKYRDRYTAVNTTNQQTVEFRLFRATLNRVHFMANLEFVAALVEFCKPGVTGLSEGRKYTTFLSWLTTQRKTYPNLVYFLASKGYTKVMQKRKTA